MTPHLLHVFPSFGIGGMPLRTVRVINHLGSRCRHTIISLDGVLTAAERISKRVKAELVRMPVDKRRAVANLFAFRRVLRDVHPNLLATYNWGAIEWAGVNSIRPLCRHIHFEAGFGRDEADRLFRRRIIARRLALARSEAVVVPSHTLERIAVELWGLRREQVRYIPDGIDMARFDVDRQHDADTGAQQERVTIGTVAPLRPEKNIARLIEVFALVADDPRLALVIAGDGSERPALERLAEARGLRHRITFLGHVARPEDVLASFDIFVLSSDTEQLPNAVLEAMAARLPIAAVDVGDVAIMVAPENRQFIVARDRPDAFAKALRQLTDSRDLRQRLGSINRDWAERQFRQEQMFEQYEVLLLPELVGRDGSHLDAT
jgi:glycosyltransferase involved in cell wall biosynthesis